MPRYFKVTTLREESICTSRTKEVSGLGGLYDFVVRYQQGQWVRSNHENAKLFVFDSLDSAERFAARIMANSDGYHIWECEVENPTDRYPYFLKRVFNKSFPIWLSRLLLDSASPTDDAKGQVRQIRQSEKAWPPGTVFADAVKLTKLVAVRHFDYRTLLALLLRRPLVLLRRPRLAAQILTRPFRTAHRDETMEIQRSVNSQRAID
jgi:hypothetical protein